MQAYATLLYITKHYKTHNHSYTPVYIPTYSTLRYSNTYTHACIACYCVVHVFLQPLIYVYYRCFAFISHVLYYVLWLDVACFASWFGPGPGNFISGPACKYGRRATTLQDIGADPSAIVPQHPLHLVDAPPPPPLSGPHPETSGTDGAEHEGAFKPDGNLQLAEHRAQQLLASVSGSNAMKRPAAAPAAKANKKAKNDKKGASPQKTPQKKPAKPSKGASPHKQPAKPKASKGASPHKQPASPSGGKGPKSCLKFPGAHVCSHGGAWQSHSGRRGCSYLLVLEINVSPAWNKNKIAFWTSWKLYSEPARSPKSIKHKKTIAPAFN